MKHLRPDHIQGGGPTSKRLTLAVLCLAALLAGCGGGSDSASTAAGESVGTVAGSPNETPAPGGASATKPEAKQPKAAAGDGKQPATSAGNETTIKKLQQLLHPHTSGGGGDANSHKAIAKVLSQITKGQVSSGKNGSSLPKIIIHPGPAGSIPGTADSGGGGGESPSGDSGGGDVIQKTLEALGNNR